MHARAHTSRRRRPLSIGEVGLLALLLTLVFGLGLYRPGGQPHEAAPNRQGLSLMNVDTAAPAAPRPAVAPARPPALSPAPVTPPAPPTPAADPVDQPVVTFNGRPLRRVKQLTMLTTAYSPDARSCGKWADGVTASGYSVWTNGMKLVAADTRLLPFGTLVSIPGYHDGKPVPVLDRGGKIKGHRLDLLYPSHDAALQWGAQRLVVDVWEYAD